MSFPTNIEIPKANWLPGETRGNHSAQHNMIANLLVAIQNKIGITGSTEPTSIQYFIDNHSHSNFYTKTEVDAALAGKQSTLGITPESTANRWVANGYASLNSSGKIPVEQLDLSNIGKYIQTALLGEALTSPWYQSNVTKTFATGSSQSGTYNVMGWRVRFDYRTKIVSVKYPVNASNGSAAIVIYSNTNVLLWTYPVANGTNEATWINFVCEPGIDYQIWCNSTTNFGGFRQDYTLTQADINLWFISGCYNNGNFDSIWRLKEVVTSTEVPWKVALSIVNKIQYDFTYVSTSVSTASREWVRFTAPYTCTLWEVKTHTTATTTSAFILLLDSSGNTLDSKQMTSGTSTVTFSYSLTWGTEYRIVMNDTSNWWTTRYYGTVAQFQWAFPYAISGIYGAGAGTVDSTNILNIKYIELDFLGKAYLSKAIRGIEPQFCKIDWFISGPKNVGDSVTLESNNDSVISGLTWLVKWALYYLQNSSGSLGTAVGTFPVNVWKAISTTEIKLTSYWFPVRNTVGDTTVWGGNGVYVYTMPRFVNEWLVMYTITANTGANNGSTMQWSVDWNRNGTWSDIWESSGSTLTERRIMVDRWFVRLREIWPANTYTASLTIWQ